MYFSVQSRCFDPAEIYLWSAKRRFQGRYRKHGSLDAGIRPEESERYGGTGDAGGSAVFVKIRNKECADIRKSERNFDHSFSPIFFNLPCILAIIHSLFRNHWHTFSNMHPSNFYLESAFSAASSPSYPYAFTSASIVRSARLFPSFFSSLINCQYVCRVLSE